MQYVANIYVVSDPKNPENEGKVMLFKFGRKIFDKLMSAVKPEFDDETPINPFDFWKGANFKLKIRKVDNMTNYDKSEFDAPSQLLPSDEEMEEVYNKQHNLAELIAPTVYKSYEEMEARLKKVLGSRNQQEVREDSQPTAEAPEPSKSAPASVDPDEDDAMAFFASLANES
jgi:hypothetical protein